MPFLSTTNSGKAVAENIKIKLSINKQYNSIRKLASSFHRCNTSLNEAEANIVKQT